jgi:SEC-C motif-containing protein
MTNSPATCPCGLGSSFASCCEPYIQALEIAPTPEALMRSRYSAFTQATQRAIAYLVETHHPKFRSPDLAGELKVSAPAVSWGGLEVRSASASGDRGTVEFIAHFTSGGHRGQLHERSSFVREGGRWLYTNGVIDPG